MDIEPYHTTTNHRSSHVTSLPPTSSVSHPSSPRQECHPSIPSTTFVPPSTTTTHHSHHHPPMNHNHNHNNNSIHNSPSDNNTHDNCHTTNKTTSTTTAGNSSSHIRGDDNEMDTAHIFHHDSTSRCPIHSSSSGHTATVVVTVVRSTMTFLLVLFSLAAVLSILSVQQYSFIVLVIWILLLLIFIGFCYLIDDMILQEYQRDPQRQQHRRRTIFHPILHTVHDYIVTGISHFVDDCRTEYYFLHTMITAHDASECNDTTTSTYHHMSSSSSTTDHETTTTSTKTRFFRRFVQPVLHYHFRRNRKRPGQTPTTATPPPVSSSHVHEMETNTTTTTMKLDGNDTNRYIPPLAPKSEIE